MKYQRTGTLALAILLVTPLTNSTCAQPLSGQSDILVCPLLHAKAMPHGFTVPAIAFTGPAGDGRRGSAGFVVPSREILVPDGTRWQFVFQRDPSGFGFQIIHPLDNGHVVVTVQSGGVTIHRGGEWGRVGWGNPNTSERVLVVDNDVLPLDVNEPYRVVSQLSDGGDYQLSINNELICRHKITGAEPLILIAGPKTRVWGGSGWKRTPFAGEDFSPELKPGDAGLILGPMDGSGPRQFFKEIMLGRLASEQPEVDEHLDRLLKRIDDAREFDRLKRSKVVGGSRGGSFETFPDQPSLLVGFKYTTSTLYGGHLTIKSVCPIFLSRDGESIGQWHGRPHGKARTVKAKPGYVVAGIVAKSGHRIDGMRLIYMRVKNGRLNPDDTYRSKWIGGKGGGHERLAAADGDPIIGIFGRQGHDVDAIGFIQTDDDSVATNGPLAERE